MRDKICELVRELLPLYIEGDLSPESEEIVKEHLEECADCRSLYDRMEKPIEMQTRAGQITAPINQIKKNAVLKLLKVFGILLLVIAVAIAVTAIIFSRPFFNGFEPVNQANISIAMEDGHPVLIMDEKAQEGRLTLIHQTNEDGTITMYISFGDFKSQYLYSMVWDREYHYDWVYYPWIPEYDGIHDIIKSVLTKDGRAGDELATEKPITVTLPTETREIYYLPNISGEQKEKWANNMYYKAISIAYGTQLTELISTDGFDFSILPEGQLIWKADN